MPKTKTHDSALAEALDERVAPPPMFRVLLLNDDFTPMDFVVQVLQQFFSKNREQATQIMLKVHNEGVGLCGIYSRDVAETKVNQVLALAQEQGHPLQCVMEKAG